MWGSYRPDHTYYITGHGNDTNLGFTYVDSPGSYGDNVGTLTVDIYCGRLDPPPIPVKCSCGAPTDLIDSSAGQTGGNAPDDTSSGPVRYADGSVQMQATDFSGGFGIGLRQARTWTNNQYYVPSGVNGTGTIDAQLPYLLPSDTGLVVVSNATNARYFDWNGSAYVPRFFDQDQLTAGTGEDLLTDTKGDQFHFFSFDPSPCLT